MTSTNERRLALSKCHFLTILIFEKKIKVGLGDDEIHKLLCAATSEKGELIAMLFRAFKEGFAAGIVPKEGH